MANKPEDYTYSVLWSEEDTVYVGRVVEFPSLAAHGGSPVAALREIREVVGYVLDEIAASGEGVPAPVSQRPRRGGIL